MGFRHVVVVGEEWEFEMGDVVDGRKGVDLGLGG
jgi:hypothetical protein